MFSVYEVPQEYSSPMALSRGHFGPLGLAQVAPKLWTSIFFQDILGWGSERCCDLFHEIERLDRVGTSTKYILVSRLLWLLGRMMIFVAFFAQSLPRILDVVTCVLLLADFFLDIDVVLTKIEQIPNTYVGTTVRVSRPRVASACRTAGPGGAFQTRLDPSTSGPSARWTCGTHEPGFPGAQVGST